MKELRLIGSMSCFFVVKLPFVIFMKQLHLNTFAASVQVYRT